MTIKSSRSASIHAKIRADDGHSRGDAHDCHSDEDLLLAWCNERQEWAINALISRHLPLIEGTCRRILGRSGETDDAIQDTLIALTEQASTINCNIGGWIRTVATNKSLAYKRSRERRRSLVLGIDGGSGKEDVEGSRNSDLIEACLSQLNERDRDLIVRHFVQGQTLVAIAQEGNASRFHLVRRMKSILDTMKARYLQGVQGAQGVRRRSLLVPLCLFEHLRDPAGWLSSRLPSKSGLTSLGMEQYSMISTALGFAILLLGLTIWNLQAGGDGRRERQVDGSMEADRHAGQPDPDADQAPPLQSVHWRNLAVVQFSPDASWTSHGLWPYADIPVTACQDFSVATGLDVEGRAFSGVRLRAGSQANLGIRHLDSRFNVMTVVQFDCRTRELEAWRASYLAHSRHGLIRRREDFDSAHRQTVKSVEWATYPSVTGPSQVALQLDRDVVYVDIQFSEIMPSEEAEMIRGYLASQPSIKAAL